MNNINSVYAILKYTVRDKCFYQTLINRLGSSKNISGIVYAGKQLLTSEEVNNLIFEKINTREPFAVGRFGAAELFAASSFELPVEWHQTKSFQQLSDCAGFFPNDISFGDRFNENIIESFKRLDVLGVSGPRYEQFYIEKYSGKHQQFTYIDNYEPWTCPQKPWSRALEGKRVLIIHPFVESIRNQYMKRSQIFPGTDILPQFDLLTLKAIQTSGGGVCAEYDTWFDALNHMYNEALQMSFDVAIIGCGAYGMPLCAMLKNAGKQAIQLAGATQILFGIKGKRWTEQDRYGYVKDWYNEAWVSPDISERPLDFTKVEEGCYW